MASSAITPAESGVSDLPDGTTSPLDFSTPYDHSGLVIIITAICLGFALASFGLRVYFQVSRSSTRCDDIFFTIAVTFLCAQSAIVFLQVDRGWGKLEKDQGGFPMLKAVYTAEILYIGTLFLSKCSSALFYLRIIRTGATVSAIWVLVILCSVWTVVSLMLLGIRCNMGSPWIDITTKCSTMILRWKIITAMDCIIELGISSISILLASRMHVRLPQKAMIVGVFTARLLIIAPAILHFHFLNKQFESPHPYLDGSYTTICAQIQLGYALVSNTIPCLKVFMTTYQRESGTLSSRPQTSDASSRHLHLHPPGYPRLNSNSKSDIADSASNNGTTPFVNYSRPNDSVRNNSLRNFYTLPRIPISPKVSNPDLEEWSKPALPERSRARRYCNFSTPTPQVVAVDGSAGPSSESDGVGKGSSSRPSTRSYHSGEACFKM